MIISSFVFAASLFPVLGFFCSGDGADRQALAPGGWVKIDKQDPLVTIIPSAMWVWVKIKPPGPPVLVHVSIYQASIVGYLFLTHSHVHPHPHTMLEANSGRNWPTIFICRFPVFPGYS